MRKLDVFVTADALPRGRLAETERSPLNRAFNLRDQLQRAALSVSLNLVEGSQRTTTREYVRFVEIAAGSAAETAYLLSVLKRRHPEQELEQLEKQYDALVARLQRLRLRLLDMASQEKQRFPVGARPPRDSFAEPRA